MANQPSPGPLAELKWTSEKPTEAGWYWMTSQAYLTPRIVAIEIISSLPEPYVHLRHGAIQISLLVGSRWAGPLKPPSGRFSRHLRPEKIIPIIFPTVLTVCGRYGTMRAVASE
jgi:hypothetical protein